MSAALYLLSQLASPMLSALWSEQRALALAQKQPLAISLLYVTPSAGDRETIVNNFSTKYISSNSLKLQNGPLLCKTASYMTPV